MLHTPIWSITVNGFSDKTLSIRENLKIYVKRYRKLAGQVPVKLDLLPV